MISKKGQKFVDVELQALGDANIKIADLEDSRRELIALSGVPAPYLGYADVVELREQLVHSNIVFATEIVSIQHTLTLGMNELSDKIASTLGLKKIPSKYAQLSLKPPVVLILQMLEQIMGSIMNIQQGFQTASMDFDPYYFLKRYLPTIDWAEFTKEAKEYKLFLAAQATADPQDANGGQF